MNLGPGQKRHIAHEPFFPRKKPGFQCVFGSVFRAISAIGVLAILMPVGLAIAGSVQESEQALSQAQNNYFNTVMQNGSMSAQQRAQLYNQTVAPAQSKLSESISHTWSDTVNSRLQASSNVDPSKSPASQMLAKKQKQLSGGAQPVADSSAASQEPSVTNASYGNTLAPRTRRGETVLSGAGIKPILEFPGRRPSPSPLPNP